MQKIIFLVRGLLKNCNVFILDEPFSSIDQNTRKNVLRMIDETTRGRTVIVITHDIDGLNTILDRIVSM
jgi:ABC-type Mn2+/Zn2+ transport system ATPase subunit